MNRHVLFGFCARVVDGGRLCFEYSFYGGNIMEFDLSKNDWIVSNSLHIYI